MAWPYTYNFNYYVGDLCQFVLYPRDSGEQFNLSGYSALFVISTQRGNANAIVLSASAQVSSSPSRVLCTIYPNTGKVLTGSSYVYDIEIYKNDESYTLLTGTISTQLDIPKA